MISPFQKVQLIDVYSKESVLDEETDSAILTADDKTIFQQQIQVEPPDLPNANSASPVAPGLGWAPSIPYIGDGAEDKANLKDLLMRAKAGKKAGEFQEEAHLNFCLAMAYEEKKQPRKANYYYTDYFKSAKILDDKIGMAFARNRIGVNYHKMKKHDKSLENHKANIELSDIENIFAGYYNSGISLRNLKQPAEALEYFQRALEWSLSKQDLETECLVNGQIGITLADLGKTADALVHLEKCKEMSRHIKNFRLNLDSLILISRLKYSSSALSNSMVDGNTSQHVAEGGEPGAGHNASAVPKEAGDLFEEALDYAKKLGDKKYATSCIASLGILKGTEDFERFTAQQFGWRGVEEAEEGEGEVNQSQLTERRREVTLRASKQLTASQLGRPEPAN